MNPTALLLSTFILSIVGLFTFIWSLRKGLFDTARQRRARHFRVGRNRRQPKSRRPTQRPQRVASVAAWQTAAVSASELAARILADRSSSLPALVLLSCAVVWLIVASAAGLLSSLKLHMPDLLTEQAWLTFGRLRTMHLNAVAYGWAPMGLLGLATWMMPRLLRTELVGGRFPCSARSSGTPRWCRASAGSRWASTRAWNGSRSPGRSACCLPSAA